VALTVSAQAPNGTGKYYRSAHGKEGAALKTALYQLVKNPSVVPYDSLWHAYVFTDMRPEGYVWDMYSNTTAYANPMDKDLHKNNYEGSGINREHSMPKSWFNPVDVDSKGKLTYKDIKPMYSDVVHVIPTDGYINNMRSDLPYGETEAATKGSQNMFSKVGPSAIEGYSGTIFEPADEYKGDLARIYFYMATCYESLAGTWTSDMFDADSDEGYQPYSPWAFDLLMKWAADDPVSEKETARNEAVWKVQGNRNPFVDYPGLEQYVWGDKAEEPFSYDGSDATVMPEVTPAVTTEISLNNKFFGVGWTGSRDYWDRSPMVGEQDGVSITYCRGIEGKDMYVNNQQMRLYTNNTLTFRTEENEMTSIELNVVQNDKNRVFTASTGEMDGYTWTGNAKEVQFQLEYASAGVVRINKVKVEVTETTGIQMATVQTVYDGYTYNLMGVRVDADQLRPGIYIRNGKKFVIR
jgi:endonuclease I